MTEKGKSMSRLTGRIAVIIGASGQGSMGEATARRFAAEGAKVVLAARREAPIQALAKEIDGLAVQCDISNEADVAAVADAALKEYGQLDIAANFAGINVQAAIAEIDAAALKDAVDIQFNGAVFFIKHMARAIDQDGSIINTSSLTATLAPMGMTAYAGTKAGIDHVVKIAATEYGDRNIRVNAITPGMVRSEMTDAIFENAPNVVEIFEKETRLPRLGTVDDIANAVLWLASDEAFLTGQNLQVTGGADLGKFPLPSDFGG